MWALKYFRHISEGFFIEFLITTTCNLHSVFDSPVQPWRTCPSRSDCGRRLLSWKNRRTPGSCSAEPWSVAPPASRYGFPLSSRFLSSPHWKYFASKHHNSSRPLAVAGAGPPRDVRERPARSEQSPREHPHRSPHLDHGRQAGGSQWQHADGGEDH